MRVPENTWRLLFSCFGFFFFKGFFLSVDASYEQMTKTARVNDEHMRTECELSMKRRALRVLYLWVNLEMYFGAYAFPFSVSGWLGCMAKDSLSLSPRPRTCVAYYRWFSGCESCASAWFKVGYRKTGEGRPPPLFHLTFATVLICRKMIRALLSLRGSEKYAIGNGLGLQRGGI
jgi:hypothetical protein